MTATVDFNEILDTKPVCLKANLTQHETSVLLIPLKLWTNINNYMRGEFLCLGSPDDDSRVVVRGSLISTVSTFTTSTSSFCTWNFIPNKVHLSSNGLVLISTFSDDIRAVYRILFTNSMLLAWFVKQTRVGLHNVLDGTYFIPPLNWSSDPKARIKLHFKFFRKINWRSI